MWVITNSYYIEIAYCAVAVELAAYSVLNYLHTFMFLLFMGIGSSIQSMISYFYGANLTGHIKETIKIAEKSAVVIGGLFLVIGYFAADYLVAMFGITSTEITDLAVT